MKQNRDFRKSLMSCSNSHPLLQQGEGKKEDNMDADKITLASYIVYLQCMYKRYGNISIAHLKHIERIRKRRISNE